MANPKPNRNPTAASRPGEPRGDSGGLIPTNPLPLRVALLQVGILVGVPILLLILARYVLTRFFPSLGY